MKSIDREAFVLLSNPHAFDKVDRELFIITRRLDVLENRQTPLHRG